ncbi:DIP1281 family NlpC/P60 protein [Corynebacterium epidermidicanis]|uniref:Cell wall-associated hydrolase, invasion-associated protein n=1 Tax=Corynebacterium epidermidicanis TaxID=1050174 RepID=A0A0G3GWH6_9CORY|nr:NlpC/P60 family protein [Corynebacterium epidermidicanis]AKK03177.1 cell wall-associated hydrolase, invasion-associated protein [Corynebacterium epidermidicanis]
MATQHTSTERRQRTRSIIAAATAVASFSTLSSVALPAAHAQPAGAPQAPNNPTDGELNAAQQDVLTSSESVSKLALELTQAQSELAQLESLMGGLREAVNKAIVDLQAAQAEADNARSEVDKAKSELDTNQREIDDAQQKLNEISRTAYRQGAANNAVAGAAGTANTADALARQSYLRLNAQKQRATIEEIDRLRAESANKESTLREARIVAEAREQDAKTAEGAAQQAVRSNAAALQEQSAKHAELKTKQVAAQVKLDAAKNTSSRLQQERKEYQDFLKAEQERKEAERRAAEAAAAKAKAEAEARARAEAEAEAKRQAEAAAAAERAEKQRQAEQARAAAAEAAAEAAKQAQEASAREQARKEAAQAAAAAATALGAATAAGAAANGAAAAGTAESAANGASEVADTVSNGIFAAEDYLVLQDEQAAATAVAAAAKSGAATAQASTAKVTGDRAEMIEAVIARAQSQIGMPYAWGGGNASGPTRGIRDGGVADSYGDYNKIGFDCSGLTLYAFAAAGISLPHYTGYQYNQGQKIDPSNMQRGDLIFWGPNAEHHVAIYLGNGQMIEAPQSGSTVQISPVRWAGMSPYAVRLI